MNGNKKKAKKFFIILLVAICSYYAISLCLMGKEQIKERFASKEILLPIYLKYGYKLDLWGVTIDREAKTFECYFSINHRKLYNEVDMVSTVYKSINRYLKSNKDYFLNDGYKILLFINTKQTEFIYLTNRPLFKEQKGLSNGLKHAYMEINGDISLLKGFHDLEAMDISVPSVSDLSVLNNFTNLKYIAFEDGLSQKQIDQIHKILPECIVKLSSDMHPFWYGD